MNGETLRGLGGDDPDELAAVLCAALRYAGHKPHLRFILCKDGDHAHGIEVLVGERVIAMLPMSPMPIATRESNTLLLAIEALGRIECAVLTKALGPAKT